MKVISRGNARVNCDQCGSTLEYEWTDIQEYGKETVVICPVCGRLITVDGFIAPNPYAALRDTNTLTITPDLTYRPYDVFVRDSTLCSSATISSADAAKVTVSNAIENSEHCTLTASI